MAPSKSEQAELRELQRKAYGRDGGLTEAEARRLRELERVAAARPAPQATAVDVDESPASEEALADDEAVAVPVGASDQEALAESAAAPVDGIPTPADHGTAGSRGGAPGIRALLRAQWRVVAVAAVVLLAVGIGAGWALFGARGDGIPLTDEQQQRRLELSGKEGYDEGSVRAIGQDDDALVWYGTKNEGEDVCLVLDVAGQSGENCQPRKDLTAFSLSAMTTVPGDGDDPPIGVMAFMMFSTLGEPLVGIQRWDQFSGVVEQFTGDDRERAEELVDGDQVSTLTIVGYFRDEPVWLMDRSAGDGVETCLVIDGAEGRSTCRPNEDAVTDGIAVYVSDDDVVPGQEIDAATIWSLEVAYTPSRTPYLTIIRNPEVVKLYFDGSGSLDGSRLELGGEYGDPIEVVPPSTDAKG
jgi:hypothetical protein